ncbi:Murein L,D-transpeptidase YcbB/YkuD [Sphingomonas palmae]|uniref:Murein L,D-transpeptidase YcbB/YkuD n=1 Tax=Sphingomonas palmae TaxID=1855283 RepID=A0A1H7MDB9_9SPHN|nr:L,D-transpeptidase family protein [Sphingomonas palmae]SEL08715.1 Murein L,D-transpeptidase YcbB/YkuD [Sphingomonas palmae]
MQTLNAFEGEIGNKHARGTRGAALLRVVGGASSAVLAVMASHASAQIIPPAAPPVTAPATPAPAAASPAARMIAQPLPRLTDAQTRELAKLIAQDEVRQGLRQGNPRDLSDKTGDALVRAALDHARAVHAGRLDASDFERDWGIRPQAYDPLPGFVDAVERDRLAAWVASLPPPYAGYDALVAGLARYRQIAADGGWGTVPAAAELKYGRSGPAVAALRKRLAAEDPQVSASGDKFDADLLAAVRRAQRRYGLNPAGDVGAQTLAALNVPVAARMRQISANMERWRWLPAQLEQNRVQVNVAAAVLTVFDGDAPVMSMKAVTGRPGNETPMLVSSIHSVVLNPPWNVPSSIADKELWPKERANPGYLKRNGFRVIDTGGGGKRLQQSSEKSALGRYKFDFPNDFAVYLHDTPAQAGFSRFDRLASHGCVRLEKPEALAKLLMKTTPQWQPEAIDATVAAGKTVRAQMAQPVAVYLLYWTAFASPSGQVGFRDDPYNWDSDLASKVEARQAKQTLASL